MRFVPIKADKQQAVLSLHRVRQGFVKARTAQANQIRGLLSEFGVIIAQGRAHIAKYLSQIMEKFDLPGIKSGVTNPWKNPPLENRKC